MSERTYTVTTQTETIGSFREEWMRGEAGGKHFTLDLGISSPVLTVNVLHGDRWVRESVDLMPMLTEWVRDMHKELRKMPVDHDE